jgi:hypothetical protein
MNVLADRSRLGHVHVDHNKLKIIILHFPTKITFITKVMTLKVVVIRESVSDII